MMNSLTASSNLSTSSRRAETSDAASLIVALLMRFREIATFSSRPADGRVEFTFIVRRTVRTAERTVVQQAIVDHIDSLAELSAAGDPGNVEVGWEAAGPVTFVRISRDAASLSREELATIVALLSARFAGELELAPLADDAADDDPAAQDELVDYALDSLRDPSSRRALVGLREEKKVVVYFHPARKKAKARARS
jgi:hypothetical protein